jgi:hypothetical protein
MGLIKVKSKAQGGEIWAYSLDDILEYDPLISLVYGKRSNGKTFAAMRLVLKDYLENKNRSVWVRRIAETFKDPKVKAQFNAIIEEGDLDKTIWQGVEFKQGGFYLYYYTDDDMPKKIYDDNPFCYAANVAGAETHKGGNYEHVHYVVFDEFLSRQGKYLPDEPVLFANLMSTIVRYQDKARFILLANTVNMDSDYFDAFGIDPHEIPQGSIRPYYNDKDECLCVEYVENVEGQVTKSDKYFGFFKSGRIKMITEGTWEMADYPRKPCKIRPKDIRLQFYILWKTETIRGNYVHLPNQNFIYFEHCEEAIDEDKDLIFSDWLDPRDNWLQNYKHTQFKILVDCIKTNKMYYDSDITGEVVRNYLKYCDSYTIIKA